MSPFPLGRVLETRHYFLFLLTCVLSATAFKLANVTFDDTLPDTLAGPSIIYGGDWFNSTNCSECVPGLDEDRMFGKTWHAHFFADVGAPPVISLPASSNHVGSATIAFKGTAVYVFCALPHAQNIDMTFSLDGLVVGTFARAPTNSSGFDYNVLVYANDAIQPGTHHLTIENGVNSNHSALVFDSIIYTHRNSSPPTGNPHLTVVVIVGIVIPATVVLALLITGFLLYRRRKMRRRNSHGPPPPPSTDLVVPFPRSDLMNGMAPSRKKLRSFAVTRHPRWLRLPGEVPVIETAPPAYNSNWEKPPTIVTNG